MAGNFTPRDHDYNVCAMDKFNRALSGQVGRAWMNEDGTIAIKLNSFVVLDASKDLAIRLFPVDAEQTDYKHTRPDKRKKAKAEPDTTKGQNIPF